MSRVLLTNKSEQKFSTSSGEFYPGTSKEFEESEAIKLLGYQNIVRADKALGAEHEKIVADKEKEIERQKAEINKRSDEVKELQNKIEEQRKRIEQILSEKKTGKAKA